MKQTLIYDLLGAAIRPCCFYSVGNPQEEGCPAVGSMTSECVAAFRAPGGNNKW